MREKRLNERQSIKASVMTYNSENMVIEHKNSITDPLRRQRELVDEWYKKDKATMNKLIINEDFTRRAAETEWELANFNPGSNPDFP